MIGAFLKYKEIKNGGEMMSEKRAKTSAAATAETDKYNRQQIVVRGQNHWYKDRYIFDLPRCPVL